MLQPATTGDVDSMHDVLSRIVDAGYAAARDPSSPKLQVFEYSAFFCFFCFFMLLFFIALIVY